MAAPPQGIYERNGHGSRPGIVVNNGGGQVDRPCPGIDTYDIDGDRVMSEQKPFKLGDIYHSNAVIVGEPSRYFEDRAYSGSGGFYATYRNRRKVVITGANDGMLHALMLARETRCGPSFPTRC